MPERTLKITLEYDGARFYGWQVQPGKRTVQREVEIALGKILHHPVQLTVAGRTDAGVHAAGQVIGCRIFSDIEIDRLKKALNGVLPRDVAVVEIVEAAPDFHARYDAVSRTYRYTLSNRKCALGRSYVWKVRYPLSRELLEESTNPLAGQCNLRGFSKESENEDYSTIIYNNRWIFTENLMIFEISAIRFFHHAVRCIVGSAVEVGRGKESPDFLKRILETCDRSLAGPTAPAMGLCLVSVEYNGGKVDAETVSPFP
ncbi:MAG: tRNA pseudouridine(38-40) synthase TruA [Candidatus Latescibacter sp.]|nr:tRNA pseudouridine(38-40) synthase TruA [Candidatus Latescibacter sp.]